MSWDLSISNIAGIVSGDGTINPGINAVQAHNFQGKTSFIRALQTALVGSDYLRDGAEEGGVTLTTPEREITVNLAASGRNVIQDGEPYVADPDDQELFETFGILTENNPVREAISPTGVDQKKLSDLLLKPVDHENIDEQIEQLEDERRRLEEQQREIEQAEEEVLAIEEDINNLEAQLEEKREERESLEEVEDDTSSEMEELEDELSTLTTRREQKKSEKERKENQIEAKRERIQEAESDLEDLDPEDPADLEYEKQELDDQIDQKEPIIQLVQRLQRVNTEALEAPPEHQREFMSKESSLAGDEIECWVCGSTVPEEVMAETVQGLQTVIGELNDEVEDLKAQRRELNTKIKSRREAQEEKDGLERRIRKNNQEIDRLETEVEELEEDLEEITAEIEATREELEGLESTGDDNSERRQELTQEIAVAENKLDRKREQRDNYDDLIDEKDAVKSEMDDIDAEIKSLRSKKRELVDNQTETINETLEDIREIFGPSFTLRITTIGAEGSDEYEEIGVHLVRERDGAGVEIDADALADSERELLAFTLAIATYESFNIADIVPAILIDDVGALEAESLRNLVEYISGKTEYVITAAFPESGDVGDTQVAVEDWDVVSDQVTTPA